MPYIVPQFIEREPKIFGPFTFKQFAFVGTAGALVIFLYFLVDSFALFIFLAFLLLASAFALAFLKTSGFALPVVIQRFFIFLGRPKIYLWRKKEIMPKITIKEVPLEEKKEGESSLKVSGKSRLNELFSFLETKTR